MGRPNLRWRFLLSMLPALLATSAATDTMNPGDTLRDTPRDIRISPGEGFQLGFFPPPTRDNLLKLRYLGIWSALFSREFVVIWVANRERGINGTTGVLSFHGNGSLVLSDARGDVYWSTGAAAGVSSPVARLLDNGNFVVTGSGGGAPAWQSFDYPTDSLLPGMKLGWDLRTGMNRNITSWKSQDDPARGQYSMGMDVRGVPQLFMLQGATPRWRTGPWIGDGFSGMPEMKTDGMFNFSFHNGADEVYYRFDTLNNTILSRLVVQPTGVVERVVWVEGTKTWNVLWFAPKDQCDKFSQCGPFGVCDSYRSPQCSCLQGFERPNGCARRTPLDCRNGTDGFAKVGVGKLPDTSGAVMNPTMGLDECRAACLRNCSCTAYASTGAGCTLWGGNLTDIMGYAVGGSDLYVRVAAADSDPRLNPALTNGSESNSSQEKKSASSTSKRVLLPVVGAVLATVVLGWICWFLWRRQRRRGRKMTTERVLRKNGDVVVAGSGTGAAMEDLDDLPLMDFTSIAVATDGFSAENKLGEGGFGPVYVGRLGNGHEVAVKRLARNSVQGLDEFKNEVVLIVKLQHRNLVRLLGCCIEGDEKILVYEYMPNKSLDTFLFDKTKGSLLDWNTRYNIIKGIARGLLYLHEDSRLRIIHRDLKASNVLLDKEMNPKISDFGMARMFSRDQTEANTRRVVGT